MRKIVLLAAAASVLGGISFAATPASATGICSPWVHQLQCGLQFEWKSGSEQNLNQTQNIWGKGHNDLYGLIQAQLGANVSIKARGDQTINQTQNLGLGYHDDAINFFGPAPQTQLAGNVQYEANVDQSITQTQTLRSHDDVYGSQQGQTALNIAVQSHGGSQTVKQSQSINLN